MAREIVTWLGMGLGVIVALLLIAGTALSIRGSHMVVDFEVTALEGG